MTEHASIAREASEGELFRLLVENVQDYAIFVVDPQARVRSWNPGAERLLGYAESDVIGQPTALFFTPEDIQSGVPQRELAKAAETGRAEDARWHVRKDGSRFWSAGTITPLWDEGRNLRGFAKIMRDRTSQKHSDIALKDALAYTLGVVDTVREPLLVLGGDLRVKTANRSFYQTFQVSAADTEGRLIYDLGDRQWNIPRLRTLLEEILPQNTSFDGFEVAHEFRSIGCKIMLLNARRFYRESNDTELILLAIEDITERRRAEDKRDEIDARFTSLVKNVKEYAIFTMDPDGRITSWNVAAERTLGYSEAEILGQPFSVIFTPEDQRDDVFGHELRTAKAVGRAEDLRWHVRKGGEQFWAVGIVTPMYDSTGRHAGFSKILRDMTEQKLVEKALQQAHEETEELVRQRTAQLRTANEGLQKEIAERKCQEVALMKTEQRFQELTAHLRQVLWIIDVQSATVLYVSPGYESMYGRSCQSLIDNPGTYLDGIHPLDQEMMIRENAAMFQTGFIDAECRVLRPDQSVRWVWIKGYPVTEQGRIVRLVGVIEDITEKRLLAGQRDALLARLQLHIERMPLAYVLFDTDCRITDWNPAAQRILGYAKQEVVGRTPFDFIPSSFRLEAEAILCRVRAGDMGAYSINENLTKDGRTITCEWYNTPLLDEDGNFAGLISLGQDITARREAEESLRLRDRAIQAVTQGILITDPGQPDNPIVYASPSFLRLTAFREEEVIGRNCRFLQGKDTDPAAVAQIRQAVQNGQPCTVELLNYRKDGSSFWNELSLAPVLDADGRLTHFVGVQTDVTQRRQLENQFRQAQKMEAVGQLAGGIAHDFNNLLTVISGYSEMMLAALPATDRNRDKVEQIYKAGERAALLTRQLLTFSRKEIVEPRILDLNAVVDGACKMLRRLIGEDIRLTTAPAPSADRVKTDPGQLEQILMNLAVNARDAMPRGGRLTIETDNVELDEEYAQTHAGVMPGRYVLLAITDTGSGMTDEVKAKAFEPFFTTKGVGKGTGLGLATVYGIVKQAGGHVTLYSEVGHGTTFKIYLPSAGPVTASGQPPTSPRSLVKGRGTVLLVEDDDQVRALTRFALESLGYAVLEARDGEEALRACGAHRGTLDLLVTDVVMPGLSGREVAEAVRRLRPEAKVLYMSGYTDDAVVRHGVLSANEAFLQKPFTTPALSEKVRDVLGKM